MLLHEIGVFYTRDAKKAKELGLHRFLYNWQHSSGKTGSSHVYCYNAKELKKLIDYWNRTNEWQYTISP